MEGGEEKMKNQIGLLGRPSKMLAGSVLGLFLSGLFLPVAIVLMASAEADAQYITPTVGDVYLTPREAPCIPYAVGPSTGTTEALIVSGTTASPSKGWVNWVQVSTGPADSYLILKDTGSLSNSGVSEMVGRIHYTTTTAQGGPGIEMYPTQVVRFDPPALFTRGITVDVFGCTGGCFATVCYRKQTSQIP